ncbi:MAG: Ada metal-binding domain-containing protein [Acidobacteriota bacterium]
MPGRRQPPGSPGVDDFAGLSFDAMLRRMYAADVSADGLFITGVLSTGIYCLPSCAARKPKAQNVRFFPDEEHAKEAGLRACKRCRPDAFYAGRDPDHELLQALVRRLRREPAAFATVADLADAGGVGLSKLHGLVQRHLQTTPAELMHRHRIHKARELLRAGGLGATDVAFAVGYSSVSAFYRRFKLETGTTPGAFARGRPTSAEPGH